MVYLPQDNPIDDPDLSVQFNLTLLNTPGSELGDGLPISLLIAGYGRIDSGRDGGDDGEIEKY